MSWFGSIGCSTGGALLVSLVSVWLAGRLHELCQSATGRSRQLLRCLIIMPFFLPGLVVGYTFRQISLNLVHSPFINTGLYFLLITARSVPVGVLLHGLIPRPALSPAGRHCLRSAVGRGFVGRWDSRGSNGPLFALIFLLTFQETEIAALMQVPVWPEWLFSQRIRGLPFAAAVGDLSLPLTLELPFAIWAARLLRRTTASQLREAAPWMTPSSDRWGQIVAWIWCLSAFGFAVLFPLWQMLRGAIRGGQLLAENPQLWELILHAAVFSGIAALAAFSLTKFLPTFGDRTSQPTVRRLVRILIAVVTLTGLIGAFPLGLLLARILEWPPLLGLSNTPLPLLFGMTVWLFPRGLGLLWLQQNPSERSAQFLADQLALRAQPDREAGEIAHLRWHYHGSGVFWSLALLTNWAWFELMLPSLLAPPGLMPAPIMMYNQMHYGHIAGLWAFTTVTTLVPVAVFSGIYACHRWLINPRG